MSSLIKMPSLKGQKAQLHGAAEVPDGLWIDGIPGGSTEFQMSTIKGQPSAD